MTASTDFSGFDSGDVRIAWFSRMYSEKAACEQEFFTASSPRLASNAKAAPASEIAKAAKTRKLHRIPVSPRGRGGIYRRCRRVAQVAAHAPSPPPFSDTTRALASHNSNNFNPSAA